MALKKCLTRVYDVLLDEVSDMIEEETTVGTSQDRQKRQPWSIYTIFIIFIICTTHVPQTFVVAIKPDEFISVVLSPVHFHSA